MAIGPDLRDLERYFHEAMMRARSQQEADEIRRVYRREVERRAYPIPTQCIQPMITFNRGSEPQKPKPPLPEEHIVAAVVGYRAWNVPLFVDELRSVAKQSKWKPFQRFEAECTNPQCNGVECQCGIYAFNKMELVQKEYTTSDRSKRYVYGECWLWGRVLECEKGYRAQFAYPKALIDNGAIAKRMAEVFGVKLIKEVV